MLQKKELSFVFELLKVAHLDGWSSGKGTGF